MFFRITRKGCCVTLLLNVLHTCWFILRLNSSLFGAHRCLTALRLNVCKFIIRSEGPHFSLRDLLTLYFCADRHSRGAFLGWSKHTSTSVFLIHSSLCFLSCLVCLASTTTNLTAAIFYSALCTIKYSGCLFCICLPYFFTSWQCLSTMLCGSLRSSGWLWMKASGTAPLHTSLSTGRKRGALSPTCLSMQGKHWQVF